MTAQRADVLVVGGGVIGVCAAHYLVERGLRVTLLEKDAIAAGCSYANAGLVVPSHVVPIPRPGVLTSGLKWMLNPESPFYIRLRLDPALLAWLWRFRAACRPAQVERGMEVLQALGQLSSALFAELQAGGLLEGGYRQAGLLFLFRTAKGFQEGVEEAHLLGKAGVNMQVLDGAQASALEPAARADLAGAVLSPGDGHLDPARFVRGMAQRAEAKGCEICTGVEVLGMETSGGRVTAVRTTHGGFQGEQVVLAAGAWSPGLAGDLRLNLPVQAAKGYSLTFPQPAGGPAMPLLLDEARVAVTPLDGRLRLAGTLELAGLDLSVNRRRVSAIRRAPQAYLNIGAEAPEGAEVWAGLRPVTPDGLPLIGRAPGYENLIVAGGHAMLGMSLGPATGLLVAQLANGEAPAIDMAGVSVARF